MLYRVNPRHCISACELSQTLRKTLAAGFPPTSLFCVKGHVNRRKRNANHADVFPLHCWLGIMVAGVLYGEVASRAKAIIIKKQEYVRYSARRWKNMKKSISSTMLELNNMTEERDKERDTSSPEDSESASDNTTSTSNGERAVLLKCASALSCL